MVLDIFHIDTAIDDLPLCDCHSVVVHLIKSEVSICMECLKAKFKDSIVYHIIDIKSKSKKTCDAFLSINWSFPRVPHQRPESLA